MRTYVGIDLGTSGVKMLLVNSEGKVIAENTQNYRVIYPKNGWTEQEPSEWLSAVRTGLGKLLDGQEREAVRGISFGGQMHGLVMLDDSDNVIRPCILWNDGRTEKQTEYLNTVIGREKLSEWTGNIAFAGFTAPKLLWVKENEPENFRRISKIMLPKDYLVYTMSGKFVTDMSDASGTLLLDVEHRRWSEEMCRICSVTESQLPELHESSDVVGTLKPELASELGLSYDVRIISGAGDNAAAAVGTGTVNNGSCNISLGTSGTVFISADTFSCDRKNALHSFCHANGGWHLMGCILSAAACRKWWLEDILGSDDYPADDSAISEADTEGIYFLPYLSGERSPHNDVNARGAFIGLSSTTSRAQMSRAVMEGVAFAIRDCLEVARSEGIDPRVANICGGGAKSRIWRQIISDVLDIPVTIPVTEQGPAYGAGILAMVGCGEYCDISDACGKLAEIREKVIPDANSAKIYGERFSIFRELYPALRDIKLK